MQTPPETMEGTWKEISALADKFGNQRLRVTILPDETTQTDGEGRAALLPTPAERADWLRARLVNEAARDAEEEREAQAELNEFKQNMNAERLRSGAEPIF